MKEKIIDWVWDIIRGISLLFIEFILLFLFAYFIMLSQLSQNAETYLLVQVCLCGLALMNVFLLLYLFKKLQMFSFDLSFLTKKNFQVIILGGLAAGLVLAATHVFSGQSVEYSTFQSFLIQGRGNLQSPLFIIILLVCLTIVEEIISRGTIMGVIFKNNLLLGAIVTSFLSAGVPSSATIYNWIAAVLLNVIFGLAYRKTQQLAVPIVIHLIVSMIVVIPVFL